LSDQVQTGGAVELLLVKGTFRPHRHAHLLPDRPTPPLEDLERLEPMAYEDLPEAVREWDFFLETGIAESCAQEGRTEAQISGRLARGKWREHGPALAAYWGPKRTRESWAWGRWGAPEPHENGLNGKPGRGKNKQGKRPGNHGRNRGAL
jgi:hypothetical protein